MSDFPSTPATAFAATRIVARGALRDVALAVKASGAEGEGGTVLVFDDRTGAVIDLDLRGAPAEILSRLEARAGPSHPSGTGEDAPQPARGRGRPRLGVVAREVTLLPRHWEWLSAQKGGASQALRRLVDEARRGEGNRGLARASQDAAYRFMSAMAGDLPGFEEAVRALFAADAGRFTAHTAAWPADVRAHALRLASAALGDAGAPSAP